MFFNFMGFVHTSAIFGVCLTNGRGSRNGRKHSTPDHKAKHSEFYDFDLVRLGVIDAAEQLSFFDRKTGTNVNVNERRTWKVARALRRGTGDGLGLDLSTYRELLKAFLSTGSFLQIDR